MVSQLVPVSQRGNSDLLPLLKVKLLSALFSYTADVEQRKGSWTTDFWQGICWFPPLEAPSDEVIDGERKVTHSHLLTVVWSSSLNHKQVSSLLFFHCRHWSSPFLCGVPKPEKRGVNTGALIQPDPRSQKREEEICFKCSNCISMEANKCLPFSSNTHWRLAPNVASFSAANLRECDHVCTAWAVTLTFSDRHDCISSPAGSALTLHALEPFMSRSSGLRTVIVACNWYQTAAVAWHEPITFSHQHRSFTNGRSDVLGWRRGLFLFLEVTVWGDSVAPEKDYFSQSDYYVGGAEQDIS